MQNTPIYLFFLEFFYFYFLIVVLLIPLVLLKIISLCLSIEFELSLPCTSLKILFFLKIFRQSTILTL